MSTNSQTEPNKNEWTLYHEKGGLVPQRITVKSSEVSQPLLSAESIQVKQNLYLGGSIETPSKAFLLVFMLPKWLKLNHLKSRLECGYSDIFSRRISSTVAETIVVTNNAANFARKSVQKTTFEAAEMILGPWNQQYLGYVVSDVIVVSMT